MKAILISFLFFSVLSLYAGPASKASNRKIEPARTWSLGQYDSREFGKVSLSIQKQETGFDRINFNRKNEILKSIEFDFSVPHGFFDEETGSLESEIFITNINHDQLDDFILHNTEQIMAGPQAGQESHEFYCLIQKNNKIIEYEMYPDVPCNYPEEYHSTLSYYKQHGHVPIGVTYDQKQLKTFLLKENENLIFTTAMIDKGKRLTIGIDREIKYIVYRFGSPDAIELEVIQNSSDAAKPFRFFQEINEGYTQYKFNHLFIQNGSYLYRVYNNYDERQKEDGDGVVITNTSTGKSFRKKGHKSLGSLDELSKIKWLDKEYKCCADYEDEK